MCCCSRSSFSHRAAGAQCRWCWYCCWRCCGVCRIAEAGRGCSWRRRGGWRGLHLLLQEGSVSPSRAEYRGVSIDEALHCTCNISRRTCELEASWPSCAQPAFVVALQQLPRTSYQWVAALHRALLLLLPERETTRQGATLAELLEWAERLESAVRQPLVDTASRRVVVNKRHGSATLRAGRKPFPYCWNSAFEDVVDRDVHGSTMCKVLANDRRGGIREHGQHFLNLLATTTTTTAPRPRRTA